MVTTMVTNMVVTSLPTLVANDLCKISDTEKQLPKHRSDTFHSLTAQLLFLCKRSRLEETRPGSQVPNEYKGYVPDHGGKRYQTI